jgi:hypothetical protein
LWGARAAINGEPKANMAFTQESFDDKGPDFQYSSFMQGSRSRWHPSSFPTIAIEERERRQATAE